MRTMFTRAVHWIVVDASPVALMVRTPFDREPVKRRVPGEPEVSALQLVTPMLMVPAWPLGRN